MSGTAYPAVRAVALSFVLGLAGLSGARAQGNDSTTSSTLHGDTGHSVLVDAGTADETTTGASGPAPQQTARSTPQQRAVSADAPGPNGLFCSEIEDAAARARCQSKPARTHP